MSLIEFPEEATETACLRNYIQNQVLQTKKDVSLVTIACQGSEQKTRKLALPFGDESQVIELDWKTCPVVIKMLSIVSATDYGYNYENIYEFEREVYTEQKLRGNAPIAHLVDHWICGTLMYLVFDRYSGNLAQLLRHPTDGNYYIDSTVFDKMASIIGQVNKQGFIHGDPHFGNFLYRAVQNPGTEKQIILDLKSIVLADFGRSGDFKNKLPNLYLVEPELIATLDKRGIATLIRCYDYIYLFWFIYKYYPKTFLVTEEPQIIGKGSVGTALKKTVVPFPLEWLFSVVRREDYEFFKDTLLTSNDKVDWQGFEKKLFNKN